MAAPVVEDLASIMARLDPAYSGQRQIIQGQQGALAGQETADLAGLEAMKNTGMSDIAKSANSRGVDFWGVPIEEQNRYLGEKYLPAVANRKSQTQSERDRLILALTQLEADHYQKAFSTRESQQASATDYQKTLEDRAFTAQQNALDRAAKGSSASAPTIGKSKSGGWQVSDNMDLAQYARSTGADLLTLLRQGDSKDKQAAKYYDQKVQKWIVDKGLAGTDEGNAMADKFFEELKRDRPTAFYRGG